MTELSPAAEAVLNSVTLKRYDVPYYACLKSIGQIKSDVAAALRAAANEVSLRWAELEHPADVLNAIAAELEGSMESTN